MLSRLHETIAAAAPIYGVTGPETGPSSAITIQFAPSATQAQRTAAESALAAFDWSQATHDTWIAAGRRSEAKIWVLGSQMEARAVRALALLLLQEINRVRDQPTTRFTQYTEQQLLDAFLAKIDLT